jgi:hypothetical protein
LSLRFFASRAVGLLQLGHQKNLLLELHSNFKYFNKGKEIYVNKKSSGRRFFVYKKAPASRRGMVKINFYSSKTKKLSPTSCLRLGAGLEKRLRSAFFSLFKFGVPDFTTQNPAPMEPMFHRKL